MHVVIQTHSEHQVQQGQHLIDQRPRHPQHSTVGVAADQPLVRGQQHAQNRQFDQPKPDHGLPWAAQQEHRHRQHIEPDHGVGVDAARVGRDVDRHETGHERGRMEQHAKQAMHPQPGQREHQHDQATGGPDHPAVVVARGHRRHQAASDQNHQQIHGQQGAPRHLARTLAFMPEGEHLWPGLAHALGPPCVEPDQPRSLSISLLSSSSEPNWMVISPISSILPRRLTRFLTLTSTGAISRSDSSSSTRRTSSDFSFLGFCVTRLNSALSFLAMLSASRTDIFLAAIWLAAVICVALSSASSARAWPMSRSPAISMVCTGSARFKRRSRLLAALRERPTAWPAASCVRPNSRIRRCRPCASSSGLRSSRWMFSISAIAAAASLGTSRTSTGTLSRPASLLARKRRSPAMISYLPTFSPSLRRRTRMGCMMPCALMDSASSYSAPSSMWVRGWYTPATMLSSAIIMGVPLSAAGVAASRVSTLGPSRASSPRPRPLGFLVTMFFLSFKPL